MVKGALSLVSPAQLVEKQSDWNALVYNGGHVAVDIFTVVSPSRNTQTRHLHRSMGDIHDGPYRFYIHPKESPDGYQHSRGFFSTNEYPFKGSECSADDTIPNDSLPKHGSTTVLPRRGKKSKKLKRKIRPVDEVLPMDKIPPVDEIPPPVDEPLPPHEEAIPVDDEALPVDEAQLVDKGFHVKEEIVADEGSTEATPEEANRGTSPTDEISTTPYFNDLDWTVLDK